MQPLQAFNALLLAAGGVTALVGAGAAARIYPLELPLGTAYPAIVIDYDNDAPIPTIDASQNYGLRSADVDLILFAKTAASLQAVASAVEAACNFQRGTFGGINVVSIGQADTGKAAFDSRLENWYLTVHFPLTYRR
jgi:hypothetical protein